MDIDELYEKRRSLIKRYQEAKAIIKRLTPPDGCMWTDIRKENELLIARSEINIVTRLLDENKTLIHLELKGD